jgi:hypothetical protein
MLGAIRWFLVATLVSVVLAVLSSLGQDRIKPLPAGEMLGRIAQHAWFYPAAIFLAALTAGAWLDWFLRKEKKRIGIEFINLATRIENRTNSSYAKWPDIARVVEPDIVSTFIRAKRQGIWTPSGEWAVREDSYGTLINYLRMVGQLQADGRFRQARETALTYKAMEQEEPATPAKS